MRVRIVQIENSWGVHLPRAFLEQCGFTDTTELSIENGSLVLTPTTWVRSSWQERFTQATDIQLITELDILLPDTASVEWDDAEWHW